MSFADWVSNGWLVAHKSSKQEIGNLLGIVARDLKDSEAKDVSDDWRFAIAYNAALQAATAALAAAGYRASRESHHYRVIHSLELTVRKDAKFIRAFDAFSSVFRPAYAPSRGWLCRAIWSSNASWAPSALDDRWQSVAWFFAI